MQTHSHAGEAATNALPVTMLLRMRMIFVRIVGGPWFVKGGLDVTRVISNYTVQLHDGVRFQVTSYWRRR